MSLFLDQITHSQECFDGTDTIDGGVNPTEAAVSETAIFEQAALQRLNEETENQDIIDPDSDDDDEDDRLQLTISEEGLVDLLGPLVAPFSAVTKRIKNWLRLRPGKIDLNIIKQYAVENDVKYSDLMELEVPRAYGQKGWTVEAVQRAADKVKLMQTIATNLLPSAEKRFGDYLNRAARLNGTLPETPLMKQFPALDLTKEYDKDRKLFDPTIREGYSTFGECFQSLQDFYSSCDSVNRTMDSVQKVATSKMVLQRTQRVSVVLDRLLAKMKTLDISRAWYDSIAADINDVAKWVEWYAVSYHQIYSLTLTLKETTKLIRN